MERRLAASILLLVLVIVSVLSAVLPATGKGTAEIMINVDAFESQFSNGYTPAVARVIIGVNNTVRWNNADDAEHTVVSFNGGFRSGILGPGASFNYTFTSPGTFRYHCIIHSWMNGTVIVNAGSPIASTTNTTTISSTSSNGPTTETITTPGSAFPTTSVAIVLLVVVGVGLVLARVRRTRSQ